MIQAVTIAVVIAVASGAYAMMSSLNRQRQRHNKQAVPLVATILVMSAVGAGALAFMLKTRGPPVNDPVVYDLLEMMPHVNRGKPPF